MNAKFQDIKPKVAGLACEIQVCNLSGHDVLTTFDPGVDNSVELATEELSKFWDECIQAYGGRKLKPIVHGIPTGETEGVLIDPKAEDFDLSLFENVTVMPFPLAGG